MSEAEIKQKLIDNGLENYVQVFQDNHLFDEKVLYEMTNEDYISIGVTILGDRKKLLLLFKPTKESSTESTEQSEEKKKEIKEEYINTYKNGKEYCYKSTEPDKLLCRKCHAVVSEDSTLCWNCNNNLVEQKASTNTYYSSYSSSTPIVSSSSMDDNTTKYTSKKETNKGKIVAYIIIAVIAFFITYTCVSESGSSSSSSSSRSSYSSSSSSSSSSKDLSGVSASLSTTQLEIKTTQTLHNVRIRINGDYTYEVSTLTPGTYTAGLTTFADSKGNRFNPFTQKVTRVTIFCKEGSTGFTPK